MQSDAILCAAFKANYGILHIKHTIHKQEKKKKKESIPKMSPKLKIIIRVQTL